jgi:chromosome segregation ATPase
MPKAHELERRIQELELRRSELGKEISMRNEEITDLVDCISKKQSEIEAKSKEHKETMQAVESNKVDLFNINSQINQISRECDKMFNEIECVRLCISINSNV